MAFVSLALTGCGLEVEPSGPTTSVAPVAGEDLSAPCRYEMHLAANPGTTPGMTPTFPVQAGVLVIFERADSMKLFDDAKVQNMAQGLHFATVFAYECDAASFDDLQFDARKGPGRALFQALTQFATITSHPELATANVFLFGFSAAGYLSMTMSNAYPSRVLGAVLDAPATGYADLDDVAVTPAAAGIPMMILAGADDIAAGTHRPNGLFERGWAMGAPWVFGVQTNRNHCCTDATAPLLIPWVTAIVGGQTVTSPAGQAVLRALPGPAPATVSFSCTPDNLFDVIGWPLCQFTSAGPLPSTVQRSQGGWLPDTATANAWVTWVNNAGSD